MKKVLSSDDIEVSRTYFPGSVGMIRIKDLLVCTEVVLYPEEAFYLMNALKELLEFDPESSNPPPDQL